MVANCQVLGCKLRGRVKTRNKSLGLSSLLWPVFGLLVGSFGPSSAGCSMGKGGKQGTVRKGGLQQGQKFISTFASDGLWFWELLRVVQQWLRFGLFQTLFGLFHSADCSVVQGEKQRKGKVGKPRSTVQPCVRSGIVPGSQGYCRSFGRGVWVWCGRVKVWGSAQDWHHKVGKGERGHQDGFGSPASTR